jgi:hypothetical protein
MNVDVVYTVSELLAIGRSMPDSPLPRLGEDVDFAIWAMTHFVGAVSGVCSERIAIDDIPVAWFLVADPFRDLSF